MDVVFILAPRINAAGRLESGVKAVQLMLAKNLEEAIDFATAIELNNTNRKDLDKSITLDALDFIKKDPEFENRFTTVVHSTEWHKGVIGIVASRLIESYFKPTIVLTEEEGVLTGSARSIPALDIHEALMECEDLLIKFGGHAMAAGMSLDKSNLDKFKKRFEKVVRGKLTKEDLIPEIKVDLELDLNEIKPNFYSVLKQFAPFGPFNLNPIFKAKTVVDANGSKTIGADHSHLKLWIKQLNPPSNPIGGIGFGLGEFYPSFANGKAHSMLYSIEENEWNDQVNLQLNVKDLKVEE
jgi:single-stranded-DNA-specific exonuclease